MSLTYDDIVVGAGSSGCVIAGRLAEAGSRVLLLEAGPVVAHPPEQPPDELLWDRMAHARSGAVPVSYPSGRVVGGGSAINGAIALRALPVDFEAWTALGIRGWSWADVQPHYGRIALPVERPSALRPLQGAFLQACDAAGWPRVDDFNDGAMAPGAGMLSMNRRAGVRVTSAQAYLGAQVALHAGCTVRRVLFEGRRAAGVEWQAADGQVVQAQAGRVTLCAGAIGSPVLLLRSGLGPSAQCQAIGVDTLVDLPGVGANLMDHAAITMWWAPAAGTTHESGEGPEVHQAMARLASREGEASDLTIYVRGAVPTDSVPMLGQLLGAPVAHALSVVLARATSRGRVSLAGLNTSPRIDLQLGSASDDLHRLAHGVRAARRLLHEGPLARHVRSVWMWSDALVNDGAALHAAVAGSVGPTWHAAGTARMGPVGDVQAVVDERCHVNGVERLRVVDASALPVLPSVPPQWTCLMAAERVAAWMTEATTE